MPDVQTTFTPAGALMPIQPDPNADSFGCEGCERVLDIEDSIRFNDCYLCPDCAHQRGALSSDRPGEER